VASSFETPRSYFAPFATASQLLGLLGCAAPQDEEIKRALTL
jgi:hypothetical protein